MSAAPLDLPSATDAGPGRAPRPVRAAPWVSTAARLVLAGVLLVAGGLKAMDPQASVQAVRAYELLPPGATTLVGWTLPFVEIVLGLLLLVGVFTRALGVASAVLLTLFVAAVLSAAARGLSIDCGCFGSGGPVPAGQTDYAAEVARDLGLLALAGWLVRHPRSRLALQPLDAAPTTEPAGLELPERARAGSEVVR